MKVPFLSIGIKRARPEYFLCAAALLAFFLFFQLAGEKEPSATLPAENGPSQSAINPYESAELEARAAFVYESKTKRVLFKKNENEVLPLASLTKVMTAVLALSIVPETTLITISARAVAEEGESGLKQGERWMLRELTKKMLVESSNDAAYAVSSAVGAAVLGVTDEEVGRIFFLARMNEEARRLGLSQTLFRNETGLDLSETEPGSVSTARETALLFGKAVSSFPAVFAETRFEELPLTDEDGETRRARNTNHDVGKLPLLIASKTGYTDLAGGNLAIAFDAGFGNPVVVVVLGSTAEGRFTDAEKLTWATLQYLTQNR